MAFDVKWTYKIIDNYSAPLKKINKNLKNFLKASNKACASTEKLTVKVEKLNSVLKKDFTSRNVSGLNRIRAGHLGASASARRATSSFSRLRASIKRTGNEMLTLRNVMVSGATLGAFIFPIKKAVEFESAMVDVQRVTKFTNEYGFSKFRKDVFETARYLGKMPKEIGQMAYEASKMGIKPIDLKPFLNLVGQASVAYDMSGTQISTIIGSLKGKLGLDIPEVKSLLDSVNSSAANLATTGKRVSEVLSRTSGVLGGLKMPTNEMAGWATFADLISVSPRKASTGLRLMMNKMREIPRVGNKMLKNPTKAIKNYLQFLKKMPERRRFMIIKRRFKNEAGEFVRRAVQQLIRLDKAMDKTSKKFSENSMKEETKKKLASAEYQLLRMKSAFEELSIAIGDVFLPYIKKISPVIQKFAKDIKLFLQLNPKIVKMTAVFIGAVAIASALALVLGSIILAVGVLLNPISWLVIGVMALAVGFALFWKRSARFRESIEKLANVFDPILKHFKTTDNKVEETSDKFKLFETIVCASLDGIGDTIRIWVVEPLDSALSSLERLAKLWDSLFGGKSKNPYSLNLPKSNFKGFAPQYMSTTPQPYNLFPPSMKKEESVYGDSQTQKSKVELKITVDSEKGTNVTNIETKNDSYYKPNIGTYMSSGGYGGYYGE